MSACTRSSIRAGLLVAALTLAGCSALDSDDAGGGIGGDGGRFDFGFDVGPDPDGSLDAGEPCAEDEHPHRGGCVGPVPVEPAALCAFVESLEAGCTDLDGDCYVADCEVPLDDALLAAIRDCDDGRGDVAPGAAEVCDDLDNDCDGAVDEGHGIGEACEFCGAAGKTECSVVDPAAAACSTAPGQSDARTPPPEICDGVDDDCDGQVDERCRFDLPPAGTRAQPAICGDRVLVVEDGALVEVTAGETAAAPVPGGEGAWWPSCTAEGAAWLQARAGGAGCAETERLLTCDARLRARAGESDAISLTDYDRLGPPVVDGGRVRWHRLVDGRPLVLESGLGGDIRRLFETLDASDPTPAAAGRVAVRVWHGGRPDEVQVKALEPEAFDPEVRGPGGLAEPPTLSAAWVVWPVGDALWAMYLDDPRSGFQLTRTDGPHRRPQLDGDRVYWLDTGAAPPALRWFDLATGADGVLARGDLAPDGFTVRDGVIVWVAPHEGAPAVFRHRLRPE